MGGVICKNLEGYTWNKTYYYNSRSSFVSMQKRKKREGKKTGMLEKNSIDKLQLSRIRGRRSGYYTPRG